MPITKQRYKKSEAVRRLEEAVFKKNKEQYPSFPYPVKPSYRDDTTNALTNCVVDAIEITGGFVERVNSMGNLIKTKKGEKWVRGSSKNGTSDLHCILKGKTVKIEIKCKYTNDRQSQEQKKYQKEVEQAGGVYVIVRDFTEFRDWYERFLKENKGNGN